MTSTAEPQGALPLLDLGGRMQHLRDKLEESLESHNLPEVRKLAGELDGINRERAVQVVFAGQHDAGKSLLARCLTGRPDIQVGPGPLTDKSEAYDWNGHHLVDTPGVEAGVREEHDAITAVALQSADVILFVLTVEGMDDVTVKYFSNLVESLRSTEPLIVVVNKALAEASDRSVVEDDLRGQLGTTADAVPIMWTDALEWEEASLSSDPEASRCMSGVRELAETVTSLLTNSAAWLRLLTPLRGWRAIVDRALDEVLADIGAEDTLGEINEALEQLDKVEEQVLNDISQRAGEARSKLLERLTALGPTVTHDQCVAVAQQVLNEFNDDVGSDIALSYETTTIGNHSNDESSGTVAGLLRAALQSGAKLFNDSRPGQRGHTIVRTIGHKFNHKFRPWEIRKTSQGVGKGLVVAGVLLDVGMYVAEVQSAKREEANASAWADEVAKFASLAGDRMERHETNSIKAQFEASRSDLHRQKLSVTLHLNELGEAEQDLIGLGGTCDSLIQELTKLVATH